MSCTVTEFSNALQDQADKKRKIIADLSVYKAYVDEAAKRRCEDDAMMMF